MIDIAAIFKNKVPDDKELINYGFITASDSFTKTVPILQEQFYVEIYISADGIVNFKVFDAQSEEEYVLVHVPNASGAFIGEVNKACETVLCDVAKQCFHTEYFMGPQSKRILRHIEETYHAKPEFLWSNLPECAALRVPGKKSWFAVIGKVSKSKFGLGEEKPIEVLNLKADPETVSAYIKEYRAYPAYHMNKKCWYSIL